MLNDQQMGSPNLLGLLAGLATIVFIGLIIAGGVWMVSVVFSPWAAL